MRLRGDPVVWELLRQRLAAETSPTSAAAGAAQLFDALPQLTGLDLASATLPETVHRAEWRRGGRTSGTLHVATWATRLLPLLISRLVDELDGHSPPR